MTKIEKSIRGKRPHFFDDKSVDQLVSMFLALMSETWALKERVYTLEKLADSKGLLLAAEVEGYHFSAEEVQELDARRRAFIEDVFLSLGAEFESGAVRRNKIDDLTASFLREA